MTQNVLIYTNPGCPYCNRAKALFKQRRIPYEEIIIEFAGKELEELYRKTKVKTLPQIFIDGKFIGGLDELENMFGISVKNRKRRTGKK